MEKRLECFWNTEVSKHTRKKWLSMAKDYIINKKQLGKMEYMQILHKQWKNPLRLNIRRCRIQTSIAHSASPVLRSHLI